MRKTYLVTNIDLDYSDIRLIEAFSKYREKQVKSALPMKVLVTIDVEKGEDLRKAIRRAVSDKIGYWVFDFSYAEALKQEK